MQRIDDQPGQGIQLQQQRRKQPVFRRHEYGRILDHAQDRQDIRMRPHGKQAAAGQTGAGRGGAENQQDGMAISGRDHRMAQAGWAEQNIAAADRIGAAADEKCRRARAQKKQTPVIGEFLKKMRRRGGGIRYLVEVHGGKLWHNIGHEKLL